MDSWCTWTASSLVSPRASDLVREPRRSVAAMIRSTALLSPAIVVSVVVVVSATITATIVLLVGRSRWLVAAMHSSRGCTQSGETKGSSASLSPSLAHDPPDEKAKPVDCSSASAEIQREEFRKHVRSCSAELATAVECHHGKNQEACGGDDRDDGDGDDDDDSGTCGTFTTLSEEDAILSAVATLFWEDGESDCDSGDNRCGLDEGKHDGTVLTREDMRGTLKSFDSAPGSALEEDSVSWRSPASTSSSAAKKGCGVVARILPAMRGGVDYESRKPRDRRVDDSQLRRLAQIFSEYIKEHPALDQEGTASWIGREQKANQNSAADQQDDDSFICLLEVSVRLPSLVDPAISHVVDIHLQRSAKESAVRTMKRLEFSLHHKFSRLERKLVAQRQQERQKQVDPRRIELQRHSSDASRASASRQPASVQATLDADSIMMKCEIFVPSADEDEDDGGIDDESAGEGWFGEKLSELPSSPNLQYPRQLRQPTRNDENGPNGSGSYKRLSIEPGLKSKDLWESLSKFRSSKPEIMTRLIERTSAYDDWNDLRRGSGNVVWVAGASLVSCPPTVLSVEAFEDFNACVFSGVPLVVEAQSAHGCETIVAWFADDEIVCGNSVVYVPTLSDVGKRLSVLIIPIQPIARRHATSHYWLDTIQTNDGSFAEAYQFAQAVQALPEMPLITPLRDDWIPSASDCDGGRRREGAIRVMTYNILADLYTTRCAIEGDCKELDRAQQQAQPFPFMYYNHCPPEFLSRKRRMQLILYELLIYRPDVICLQEVDLYVFERLLEPCLRSQGYQGYYCNKASSQLEGCAAFWSLECFAAASASEMHCYPLRELFQQALSASHEKDTSMQLMKQIVEQNTELHRVSCKKAGQILQLVELRPLNPFGNPNQPLSLIVANTHLFYHPLAAHVRALQAYILAWQVAQLRMSHLPDKSPVILCGDLNSHPLSGTIKLLLERCVRDHYETWKHLYDYRWAMGDQGFLLEHGYIGNDSYTEPLYEDAEFEDAEDSLRPSPFSERHDEATIWSPHLELPAHFPGLFSGYSSVPEFTNYAIDFAESLDYILLSEASPTEPYGFSSLAYAPVLKARDMKRYVAMPNETMPSDHISLVCDVVWKRLDGPEAHDTRFLRHDQEAT